MLVRRPLRAFLLSVGTLALAGCAVISSTRQPDGNAEAPKNGFSYYLPKGKVLVTLTWNPGVRSWDVNPTVVYEPDTNQRFNLDWKDNYCFDDDITVSEDPATGLLETVNAASSDQSVNSVSNFVGSARNVFVLGSSVAPVSAYGQPDFNAEAYGELSRRSPGSIPPSAAYFPATVQLTVDPMNPEHEIVLLASPDPDPARKDEPSARVFAAVRVRLAQKYDLGHDFPKGKKAVIPQNGKAVGIAVRVPIPYELTVEEVISTDAAFSDAAKARATCSIAPRIVMLPDATHNFLVPIDKRPLVSDEVRIGLNNGMVQAIQQIRPSMFAAIMGVPKYILTAFVPLPLEIKQNQQNVSDSESRIETTEAAAGTAATKK